VLRSEKGVFAREKSGSRFSKTVLNPAEIGLNRVETLPTRPESELHRAESDSQLAKTDSPAVHRVSAPEKTVGGPR
jgi:hypothetical protein